jgi:hypothetical protein
VLVVHSYPFGAPDVKAVLNGTSAVAKVDLFDAGAKLDGSGATPTPEQLAPYDAVLVFSGDFPWQDANTLGTNLADFFDEKGRVVVAVFPNNNSIIDGLTYALQGRWQSGGYDLIIPGFSRNPNSQLPQHHGAR